MLAGRRAEKLFSFSVPDSNSKSFSARLILAKRYVFVWMSFSIVAETFKMALMNLYLHNIGDIYGNIPIVQGDSLLTDPGYRVDYVLTNPPFGKKSALRFTNEEGKHEDEDFVYNIQFYGFLQGFFINRE